MSKSSEKLSRWRLLDRLLREEAPISQNRIMEEYQKLLIRISKTKYSKESDAEKKEDLALNYRETLRKDLCIFKSTLAKNGLADKLVIGRGGEDKMYGDGKDHRTKVFSYQDRNFTIIPYLANEMTDGEYLRLAKVVDKLKDVLSEQTFDEVRFSVMSRVESDYGKGAQCVSYEDNRHLKGRQFLPLIYNAIKEKQVLHVRYKTFDRPEYDFDFHPYLLKQYNERWFAFGFNPEAGKCYYNVPLDRLVSAPVPSGHYEESVPENYSDYFNSIIGVTKYDETHQEHIVIKIDEIRTWGRVTTKPLMSQKIEKEFDPESGFGIITLDVFPNKELVSKILSLGTNVEVLSPPSIRQMLKEAIVPLMEHYSD